ncbi:MAG: phospho-N-acetylmuramoyl-pentapeptide-transferase [Lachnospiraceae bacterium]|nr:phospho-N-acetylmuramoyl-pentapeptide-transferase [Lachnospiraceae bacterium]
MESLFLVLMPGIIAFGVSILIGPMIIPLLRKVKAGQTVREDGPKTHLKKTGTPTMGGIIILIAVLTGSLVYVREYPKIIPVLFLTLGFGMIGFLDDYIKVVLHRSMGLYPWQKFLCQTVVTAVFAIYLVQTGQVNLAMQIPFLPEFYLDLGFWNVPVLFFVVIGTANGANFTDGLDGLASSVTVIIACFFTVVALHTESGIEPVTCAVVGALMGFLLFNVHPASVFMGDTGSLALGGFVAASAYMMQLQAFLPIICLIYVVEVVSVILQVTWFRISGGRRILRMAPLHHHFELCGFTEPGIVAGFSAVTALLCVIALKGL